MLTICRSIFFITTYFSDYIIVPSRSKTQVIEALEKRGFRFEGPGGSDGHAYSHTHTHQNGSHIPSTSSTTPPPSSLEDLQSRTFSSLRKNHISPIVDRGLRLVHCAARYDTDASSLSLLRNALTTSLLVDNPRFLSLTFAAGDDSASLLMEKRLIPRFSSDNEPEPENEGDLLLRSIDEIVPIILDLRRLPLEATGIVCGVASRLAEATRLSPRDVSDDNTDGECSRPASSCSSFGDLVGLSDLYKEGPSFQPVHNPHLHPQTGSFTPSEVDISFLSTARAGTIVVDRGQVRCAVEALDVESWVSGLVG